ncbi:hypothetical protein OF83DRAFT_1031287, partial [Amylostereum chailletii]
KLSTEQVWHVFFLNALLHDHAERGACLTLSDEGEQESRLEEAMEAHTKRMIEVGQPYKMHTYTICEHFIPSQSGEGHLGLRTSTLLINNHHHFCEDHIKEASVCAIIACSEPARPGHCTCTQPDHISLETYREARGKAFFQLQ